MPDDFELLEAWRGGDRTAGNTLFERHFDVVCNFFRNKVSEHVDDLIQRTFVACIEAREGFRGEAGFRAYILGVARKVLLRHFREMRRDGKTFEALETSVCDVDPSPSALVAEQQKHAVLLEGLRKIPVDLQIALELHFWEEMTLREIGEVLDIPQGTAASRVRRGKALLLDRLRKLRPGDTPETLEQWARDIREKLRGAR